MRLIFDRQGAAPAFMIIGAQKSGTTSLHWWLDRHPRLAGTSPKELHFFDRDHDHAAERSEYESKFRKGPPFFPLKAFESTPEYLSRPGVASRIHALYPDLRMIVLLRDPVERAFSAWKMYRELVQSGHFSPERVAQRNILPGHDLHKYIVGPDGKARPFEEMIDIEMSLPEDVFEPALVRRGLYLEQLRAYWALFPKDRIFIAGMGELKKAPHALLGRICTFLGVSRWPLARIKPRVRNRRAEKDKVPLPDSARARLQDIYDKPNRALFEATGPLDW